MLSRQETILWRRLELLEARIQRLEESQARFALRADVLEAIEKVQKERRHYG